MAKDNISLWSQKFLSLMSSNSKFQKNISHFRKYFKKAIIIYLKISSIKLKCWKYVVSQGTPDHGRKIIIHEHLKSWFIMICSDFLTVKVSEETFLILNKKTALEIFCMSRYSTYMLLVRKFGNTWGFITEMLLHNIIWR